MSELNFFEPLPSSSRLASFHIYTSTTTMSSRDDPAAACPVDHKTREAWLAQARANSNQTPNPHNTPIPTPTSAPASSSAVQTSCDSSTLDQSATSPVPTATSLLTTTPLGTSREVSTIPRALPSSPPQPTARAANSEADTGADKKTGNWIYPSEQMFFDAMRRKSYDPAAPDMKTIVPIHNAVNERAWHHIKQWEAGRGSERCGGPKLASFSGLSTSLTPRARWKSLLGYAKPFDRHDWVVDRCGDKIEYVIDFYAGRDERLPGKSLNFYLDVRPKLNSWEGVKMRVLRFWGF
jgi:cytochrome c heme-lyase